MNKTAKENRTVIIVGAGDLGREIVAWFPDLRVRGFLDSEQTHWQHSGMPPIIGQPETHQPRPDEVFVCAIANPQARLAVAQDMRCRGAEFMTLVHPTALVAPGATLGRGCILLPFVIVDINSGLGEYVVMYYRAGIGHDAIVGDGCLILSNAVVGSRCLLGEGVTVSTLSFCNTGISLGDYSCVGANSFAARDVPTGTTVIGVPGRHIAQSVSKAEHATGMTAIGLPGRPIAQMVSKAENAVAGDSSHEN